ncbi:MAG: CrcB family protein [Microbacterium sp.]|uniref:fluoride efflux transporter FluC n=1 Tax=Microbacterium sp. TaxID=51671 RepID=UPI002630139F|nr:CrcB family protein [Microbacterium sp.]MCX6501410.1 CrcB family protein [Microbacterium sp.]
MASGPAFSWSHLGLVVAGGALGTAARAALLLLDVPGPTGLVVALINIAGAFLLGIVTGAIIRRADTPRARAVRQFLGTGVLGGFTTYSTFAVDAVTGTALWLTLGTAVVGVLAAWLGLALTSRSATAGRAGTLS